MLEQRIQQQFFEAADLHNQSAQLLARPLAQVAEAVAGCITSGGKLLVCGSRSGQALAPLLALAFAGRFERVRPPLAALVLREESGASLAQQVAALGQPGDVLLMLDGGGPGEELRAAALAADEAELTRVVFSGSLGAHWLDALRETDVWVEIPHERAARVAEIQMLLLHSLCDAVDLQLMGEQEST
jgi:D-sedoheptulose 7-phosphate isomerase